MSPSKEISIDDIQGLITVSQKQTEAQLAVNRSLESISDSLATIRDQLKEGNKDHKAICDDISDTNKALFKMDNTMLSVKYNFRIFIYVAGGIFAAIVGAIVSKTIF